MVDFASETTLKLTEAAQKLNVSVKTLRGWAKEGKNGKKLEMSKLGGKSYTSIEAIQRFSVSNEDIEKDTEALIDELRKSPKALSEFRKQQDAKRAEMKKLHGI